MKNWRSWRSKVGEIVGIWRNSMILYPPRNLFAETYSIIPIKYRKHSLPSYFFGSYRRQISKKLLNMSSLTYVNEPGAGQKHSDLGHYSQAVIIGKIAKLSGQGGWDNDGNLDQYDWKQQIKNAFENVDRVLKAAGFRGWEDVSVVIVWNDLDLSDDRIGVSPPQLPARHRQPVGISG